MARPPGINEPDRGLAQQINGSEKVHFEHLAQLLISYVDDRTVIAITSIGKDRVETAEALHCNIKHSISDPRFGHVAAYDLGPAAKTVHLLSNASQFVLASGIDDHIHACLGTCDRRRRSDA